MLTLIERDEYNIKKIIKITDKIYFLGDRLSLILNVALYNADMNSYFYNEYEYYYPQMASLVTTIKRDYKYYLTLEKSTKEKNKLIFILNISDMLNFIDSLNNVADLFKKSEMFALSKGELVFINRPDPIVMHTTYGKPISFQPTIVKYDEKSTMGVQIEFDGDVSNVSLDSFMGLIYLMRNFDLYTAAQGLANYVKIEDTDSYKYQFDNLRNNEVKEPNVSGTTRQISSVAEKGFFN